MKPPRLAIRPTSQSKWFERIHLSIGLLLILASMTGCSQSPPPAAQTESVAAIQVYAASSLTDVMQRIREDFQRQTKQRVELTLDSSATLAKQIEQGAPADIFISANREWADYVQEKLKDRASSPKELLSNRLILVTRNDSALEVKQLEDLATVPDLHLAIGNPESVPAGIYAKQTLEALKIWDSLKDKILPADNVRSALQYVETGSALAAIVYATDLSSSPSVRRVLEIDPKLHDPIVYPLIQIRHVGESHQVQAFIDFLESESATKHFTEMGFVRLPGNAP